MNSPGDKGKRCGSPGCRVVGGLVCLDVRSFGWGVSAHLCRRVCADVESWVVLLNNAA